jgi:hypothetical protein
MFLPFIIISISNFLIVIKLMKKFKFSRITRSNRTPNTNENNSEHNTAQAQRTRKQKGKETVAAKISQRILVNNKRITKIDNKETTKILVIIASVFLLLNLPLAGVKTYYFFRSNAFNFNPDDIDLNKNQNSNDLVNINDSEYDLDGFITNMLDFSESFNKSEIDLFERSVDNLNHINLTVLFKNALFTQRKEILEKVSSLIYYLNFSINFFLYTSQTKAFRKLFREYFVYFLKRFK